MSDVIMSTENYAACKREEILNGLRRAPLATSNKDNKVIPPIRCLSMSMSSLLIRAEGTEKREEETARKKPPSVRGGSILKKKNSKSNSNSNKMSITFNLQSSAIEIENERSNKSNRTNAKRCSVMSHGSLSRAAAAALGSLSRRERVITHKLGLILFTFVACWLLFCLLWPLKSICGFGCVNEHLYTASFWLSYSNSICTPLILLYSNSKYRKSLSSVLARTWRQLVQSVNRREKINGI